MSRDTSPEAERVYFQLLAKKSSVERLEMVSQLNAAVRALAMSGLRERYPNETEVDLKVRLAELLYGADVAKRIAKGLGKGSAK